MPHLGLDVLGKSEVCNLDNGLAVLPEHEKVLEVDVADADVEPVAEAHSEQHLLEEVAGGVLGEASPVVVNQPVEGATIGILRHDEQEMRRPLQPLRLDDVRVGESAAQCPRHSRV